jgi:hypothetical protein
MKKIFVMGALAVAVAAVSQQQASAWTNIKFGAGINLGYQAGGNTLLWGAFRNGQPPGPDCGPYGCPYSPQAQQTPWFGQQPQPAPAYGYQPPPPPPAAVPAPVSATGNVPAYYRPLPVYNGAYYYPAYSYR